MGVPCLCGNISCIGDEETVMRGGRKFGHNADKMKRNWSILVVGSILKPELYEVADRELEIVDGFLRHEEAIGSLGKPFECGARVAVAEICICDRSGMTDRAGIDAIKILKIVADVGEAVLHRLGGRNAGHLSYVFQAISGGGVRPRYGDIGAVGELSIHEQLSVVGRVEDRDGRRKREGEGGERNSAGNPAALAAERSRHRICKMSADGSK